MVWARPVTGRPRALRSLAWPTRVATRLPAVKVTDRIRATWMIFQVALILSVTFTAGSLVATLVGHASERSALGLPVTGLAQTIAPVAIYVIGVLVLLGVLGVPVTPILTALGVGGLAVALALQDSPANLFA